MAHDTVGKLDSLVTVMRLDTNITQLLWIPNEIQTDIFYKMLIPLFYYNDIKTKCNTQFKFNNKNCNKPKINRLVEVQLAHKINNSMLNPSHHFMML